MAGSRKCVSRERGATGEPPSAGCRSVGARALVVIGMRTWRCSCTATEDAGQVTLEAEGRRRPRTDSLTTSLGLPKVWAVLTLGGGACKVTLLGCRGPKRRCGTL